jgi:hypothetical protein
MKTYIKTTYIAEVSLESNPEEDFGYYYEDTSDFINVQTTYVQGGLVKIDDIIENLEKLKSAGANYVDLCFHEDHSELEIRGFECRKMTDDEISAYESRLNQREVDRKEAEIKKLEERLSKLKAE